MPQKKENQKITPLQEMALNVIKQVREYQTQAEANVVSIFYKQPDLLYDNPLELEDFSNNVWRVYWTIADDIIIKEKKNTLDEITIGLYLEKHRKLKVKYEEYGGYDTIEKATNYVKVENLIGYINELKKWKIVIDMIKNKYPVYDRISDFADMTIDEIYEEQEAILNHIFANATSKVNSYNALDHLDELIDTLNSGVGVGLPLYNCDYLNKAIGGFNCNGNIYGLGANSGVGKSTTVMNYILPSIIHHNEKVVIFINEEDQTKVQRELLIWVANEELKLGVPKYCLRDGNFTDEIMDKLRESAKWLQSKKDKKNITVIPLEQYSVNIVIKLIKKYASLGVRYFILDTLKESCDSQTDEIYKSMMRDLVKLYDVVKPASKNVGLFVTYQLGKGSIKSRYLTNNEIGMAKSIVDVMSCNLMIRRPFDDEYEGGKEEITYYSTSMTSKNNTKQIPNTLKRGEHYMITFIPKNRFGATDPYQIISKFDFSTNSHKDLGICYIRQDW